MTPDYDAFEKLYISELKDQIAEKDEVITALNHTIAELQAQNTALKYRLDHADWLVEKYREVTDEIELGR